MHDQQGAGDPPDAPAKRHWRWPPPRLARAAFLYGGGRTLKEIADDPFIRSNPAGVRRALTRMFVYVGADVPAKRYAFHLDRKRADIWDAAAAKRGVTMELLMSKAMEIIADEGMIDAILDDGG